MYVSSTILLYFLLFLVPIHTLYVPLKKAENVDEYGY